MPSASGRMAPCQQHRDRAGASASASGWSACDIMGTTYITEKG
jgi:hypothetical protein